MVDKVREGDDPKVVLFEAQFEQEIVAMDEAAREFLAKAKKAAIDGYKQLTVKNIAVGTLKLFYKALKTALVTIPVLTVKAILKAVKLIAKGAAMAVIGYIFVGVLATLVDSSVAVIRFLFGFIGSKFGIKNNPIPQTA